MTRVLLVLVVLLPVASAHIDHDRPFIQRAEAFRTVDASLDGLRLNVDLLQLGDPLRHVVRHAIDPRGFMSVEHREDGSVAGDRAWATWEIARVVEYKDDNLNVQYEVGEVILRSWRLSSYSWSVSGPRDVKVGNVDAKDVFWDGNLTGGPRMTFETALAGRAFQDEGARVRPQDAIVYWEIQGLPERGTGNFHAIEGVITTSADATVALDTAENITVGIYVDHAGRRAFFDWGGQATVDRKEHVLRLALDEPVVKDGNATRSFRLSIPPAERLVRMVLVSAIEYPLPAERPTPIGAWLPFLVVSSAALLLPRRR